MRIALSVVSCLALLSSLVPPVAAARTPDSGILPSLATGDPPVLSDCGWKSYNDIEAATRTDFTHLLGDTFYFENTWEDAEGTVHLLGYGVATYLSSESWDFEVHNWVSENMTTYRWNGNDKYVRDPFGETPTKYMKPL